MPASHADRWRDTIARISFRPTWRLPITLVVYPDTGADKITLGVILHTFDVRVDPSTPIDVQFTRPLAADLDPDARVRAVRDLVHEAVSHELDECLLLDGFSMHDPHPGEDSQ